MILLNGAYMTYRRYIARFANGTATYVMMIIYVWNIVPLVLISQNGNIRFDGLLKN